MIEIKIMFKCDARNSSKCVMYVSETRKIRKNLDSASLNTTLDLPKGWSVSHDKRTLYCDECVEVERQQAKQFLNNETI